MADRFGDMIGKEFYTQFELTIVRNMQKLNYKPRYARDNTISDYLLPTELIEGRNPDGAIGFIKWCREKKIIEPIGPRITLNWKASAWFYACIGIYNYEYQNEGNFKICRHYSEIEQSKELLEIMDTGNEFNSHKHEWKEFIIDNDMINVDWKANGCYGELYPFDIENIIDLEAHLYYGWENDRCLIQCYKMPEFPRDGDEKTTISPEKYNKYKQFLADCYGRDDYEDEEAKYQKPLKQRSCLYGSADCDCSKLNSRDTINHIKDDDKFYITLGLSIAYEDTRMQFVKAIVRAMHKKGLVLHHGIISLIIESFVPDYKTLRRWATMFVTRPNAIERARKLDALLYGVEREYPLRA